MLFKQDTPEQKTTDNVAKKSIKHMDAVVTGVILGGIVGSIYGVKKLKEKNANRKEDLHEEENKEASHPSFFKRLFGKK